jgi:hypothetical protein
MAHRRREIAQIARPCLDPLCHLPEIDIELADLDRGGDRRLGNVDPAARDILARRRKRPDRPGDAAR